MMSIKTCLVKWDTRSSFAKILIGAWGFEHVATDAESQQRYELCF